MPLKLEGGTAQWESDGLLIVDAADAYQQIWLCHEDATLLAAWIIGSRVQSEVPPA